MAVSIASRWLFFLLPLLALGACTNSNQAVIPTVEAVDLQRFSGDWYVLAHIPTPLEKEAFNAVETYTPAKANRIATTFKFNKGALDGPVKEYHPTGFVSEASSAVWAMQFIWPIKAEYRVVYLDDDYQTTIIGRSKRDYVWVMARQPQVSKEKYAQLLSVVAALGYDNNNIRRVPHDGPDTAR